MEMEMKPEQEKISNISGFYNPKKQKATLPSKMLSLVFWGRWAVTNKNGKESNATLWCCDWGGVTVQFENGESCRYQDHRTQKLIMKQSRMA